MAAGTCVPVEACLHNSEYAPEATTFERYQDAVLSAARRFTFNHIEFDLPEVAACLQA